VWVGAGYVLASDEETDAGIRELSLRRLDARGAVVVAPTVFTSPDSFASIWPSLAFSGTEYGVVWLDDRAGVSNRSAFFARADANLHRVGPELKLGRASQARLAWSPAQNEWGVGYSDSAGVHFTRLTPTGAVISSTDFPGSSLSDTGTPLIATPTGWALVISGAQPRLIELNGGPPIVTTLPGASQRASLATSPGQIAVAFDMANTTITLVRVQLGGGLIANSQVNLGTVRVTGPALPQIVWDGQAFVVSWSETSATYTAPLMYARLSQIGRAHV
jgi:hypothetical protein